MEKRITTTPTVEQEALDPGLRALAIDLDIPGLTMVLPALTGDEDLVPLATLLRQTALGLVSASMLWHLAGSDREDPFRLRPWALHLEPFLEGPRDAAWWIKNGERISSGGLLGIEAAIAKAEGTSK